MRRALLAATFLAGWSAAASAASPCPNPALWICQTGLPGAAAQTTDLVLAYRPSLYNPPGVSGQGPLTVAQILASLTSETVIAGLGYAPANRAGDVFTGPVTLSAGLASGVGTALQLLGQTGANGVPVGVAVGANLSLTGNALSGQPGTVTQIVVGPNLTGGPTITGAGAISLTGANVASALGFTPLSVVTPGTGIAVVNGSTVSVQPTLTNQVLVTPTLDGGLVVGPVSLTGTLAGGAFTGDASNATVIAAGSGSSQMLATLASVTFYPAQFGAKCDGATNDTTAIQNMINAAAGAGSTAQIRPGVTCMVGALTVPSNSVIVINGTLRLIAGTDATLLTINAGASNVVISGSGTLNGNQSSQTGFSDGIDTPNAAASFIRISGLTITNFLNSPIAMVEANNVYLSYLTLTNSGHSVSFAGASVHDCAADHLFISGINDAGFAFYGGATHCMLTNSEITLSNVGIDVLNDSGQSAADSDILISNNIIFSNQTDGILVTTSSGGIGNHKHVVISGNDIFGNNTSAGGYYGVLLNSVTDATMVGNRIHNDVTPAGGPAGAGIGIGSGSTSVVISDNAIYDEGQGSTLGVGIADFAAINVLINNNMIYDDQGSPTMKYAITGTAGASTQLIGNQLGVVITTADNLTAASDTIKAESPAPSGMFTITNGLNVTGAATVIGSTSTLSVSGAGATPLIQASGTATNIGIALGTKGTGVVTAFGGLTAVGNAIAEGSVTAQGAYASLQMIGSPSSGVAAQIIVPGTNTTAINISPAGSGVVGLTGAGGMVVTGPASMNGGITVGGQTVSPAGPLSTVGAFPAVLNFTGSTNVTFPTSGTLATTAQLSPPPSDVTTTYTSSGAIALTDNLSMLNGTNLAMTVANGSSAVIQLDIHNYSATQATVAAEIEGGTNTVDLAPAPQGADLVIRWLPSKSSWIII